MTTDYTPDSVVLKDTLEWADHIKYDMKLTGLTYQTVKTISIDQNEPQWMLDHRLKCLEIFQSSSLPSRWPNLNWLHLDDIVRYAKPSQTQSQTNSWDQVDPTIKEKFRRLGIPEAEQKYLAGAGGQYDSEVVYHNIKENDPNRVSFLKICL